MKLCLFFIISWKQLFRFHLKLHLIYSVFVGNALRLICIFVAFQQQNPFITNDHNWRNSKKLLFLSLCKSCSAAFYLWECLTAWPHPCPSNNMAIWSHQYCWLVKNNLFFGYISIPLLNTDVHFCVLLAFSLCMCKENISLFFFSKLKNKSV